MALAEEHGKGGYSKHSVTMERRENITVTGVADVLSFDEESIVADTDMGILVLRGTGLHVSRLNLDDGQLMVEGEIDSLEYTEGRGLGKNKGSLLGKIFK